MQCTVDSFDKINGDVELQNWMTELITAKEDQGCGFKVSNMNLAGCWQL